MKALEALLCALSLAYASCSHDGSSSSTKAKRVWRVAVVPKGTTHEFWKAVEKGARRADLELDDLEIVWKGPTGEGDAGQQIQLVETLLADSIDGLCLAPLDARALVPTVTRAIAMNVPVVVFDSGLESDPGITSFVATDNRNGGRLAGDELARLVRHRPARMLVLRYMLGSQSTLEREDGCLEALARHGGIEIVRSDVYCGPDEASAIAASERLLATHDDIVGVFCSNESNASGFLTALQRDPRGLAGKVKVVGFDSSRHLVDALSSGSLSATVLQDPVTMGYLAVKTLHERLSGRPVQARIATGETLATPENGSSPEIQRLLKPLENEWPVPEVRR